MGYHPVYIYYDVAAEDSSRVPIEFMWAEDVPLPGDTIYVTLHIAGMWLRCTVVKVMRNPSGVFHVHVQLTHDGDARYPRLLNMAKAMTLVLILLSIVGCGFRDPHPGETLRTQEAFNLRYGVGYPYHIIR